VSWFARAIWIIAVEHKIITLGDANSSRAMVSGAAEAIDVGEYY